MPSYSTIGVGVSANDGTGTDNRTAWERVNTFITGLQAHQNSSSNPHGVTEAQVVVLQRACADMSSVTAGDERVLVHVGRAVEITEMRAVHYGTTTTPSITWTVRHDPDRSATGNEVVTGGTTTTSTTTGDDVTAFNDATVPADSFIWLEIKAKSGTTDQFIVSITYKAV